jgi:hypothetical protein
MTPRPIFADVVGSWGTTLYFVNGLDIVVTFPDVVGSWGTILYFVKGLDIVVTANTFLISPLDILKDISILCGFLIIQRNDKNNEQYSIL